MTSHRAHFQDVQVLAEGPGRLRLDCILENAGTATWSGQPRSRAREGTMVIGPVRIGYQVFDARTGLLVMDGDRTDIGVECHPGERCTVKAAVQLPPEEGHYRVVISPVEEQVAWFYDCGSEFLEVEVVSRITGTEVRSVRHATRARWRRRRVAQVLERFLRYPVSAVFRNRSLIASLVRRDILGRYRGSFGGAVWTVIHPLLLLIAYYFVFAVVLRVRFGEEPGSGGFFFYFFCGMLPWLAFSEAIGRAPNVVLEHSNFVKRVVFPVEILPFNLTFAGLVTEGFGLLLFFAALLASGRGIPWTAAYFPAILIPQLLLTAGLCWFLAALGVFARDTGQIMGFLLTVWFFLTPICYPATALPENWLWLFEKNPMYTVVGAYRAVFLESAPPDWAALGNLWIVAAGAFWLGYAWFHKVKKSFADLI